MLSQTKMQLWYPKKTPEDSACRSTSKFLTKYNKNEENDVNIANEADGSPALSYTSDGNENDDINVEFLSEDDSSGLPSPSVSDCEEDGQRKRKREDDEEVSDFIDQGYWKAEKLCCGTIFRGMYNEIMVDAKFFKPCKNFFLKRRKVEDSDKS